GALDRPNGDFDLTLTDLKTSDLTIAKGDAHLGASGDRGEFRAALDGRFRGRMKVDVAGSFARAKAATTLKLAKLDATIRGSKIALAQPMTASIAPGGYSVAGLSLDIDEGSISGNAAISNGKSTANLRIKD